MWWLTPAILALGRWRQMDHSDLKVSLGYTVSARLAWAMKGNVVLKQKGVDTAAVQV